MTASRLLFVRVWSIAAACLLLCAMPVRAQEDAGRHFTGEVISGFSSQSFNTSTLSGPYVGFTGDFTGSFMDPRILNYDISPSLVKGFQWAGPMSGPESNGVSATSNVLGGSHMPLFLHFAHENIPTPDFGPDANLNFRGWSRTAQSFGLDWVVGFSGLPTLNVHWEDNDSRYNAPVEFGGETNQASRNFSLSSSYTIAQWALSASYGRGSSNSDVLSVLSPEGAKQTDSAHDTSYSFSAFRALPLHSQFSMQASRTNSDIVFSPNETKVSYDNLAASLSSLFWQRLTMTEQVSYFSNYSDYVRQQILTGGNTGDVLPGLTSGSTAMLNLLASASFRVTRGLTAYASGSAARPHDSSNGTTGNSESYATGLNYLRRIFDGDFSVGANIRETIAHVEVESRSVGEGVFLGYSHRLPWGIQASGSGDASRSDLSYTYHDRIDAYGLNLNLVRKLGNGWNATARMTMRNQEHQFPATVKDYSKSLSLTLGSKRLQFTASDVYNSGLGYQFGNGFVLTPGADQLPESMGLLPLIRTQGNSISLSGNYRVSRRLSFRGSWSRSNQTVNDGTGIAHNGMDFRGQYSLRRIRLQAGYQKNWQSVTRSDPFALQTRMFFFEVRRDFKLF